VAVGDQEGRGDGESQPDDREAVRPTQKIV
jgi:hypothetical protein